MRDRAILGNIEVERHLGVGCRSHRPARAEVRQAALDNVDGQRVVGIRIDNVELGDGGDDQLTVHDLAVDGHDARLPHDLRTIVLARNRDRQRRGSGLIVRIRHRVGDHDVDGLAVT